MRLRVLDDGQRFVPRWMFKMMAAVSRRPAPDVLKVFMYRPGFFGQAFAGLTQDAMRGPSTWSVGQRELFAAYTSRLNQCPF